MLGLLVGAFPYDASTKTIIRDLIDYNIWLLDQNFNPKSKESDMSIIAAVISCLDRCCFYYEEDIFQKSLSKATFYEYLLKAISAANQADVARYAMTRKALRFLKHHSDLFRDLIGKNTSQSYQLVNATHIAGKKGLDKHSEEALLAILSQCSKCSIVTEPSKTKKV